MNELLALWQYLLSLTFTVVDVESSTCRCLGCVARLGSFLSVFAEPNLLDVASARRNVRKGRGRECTCGATLLSLERSRNVLDFRVESELRRMWRPHYFVSTECLDVYRHLIVLRLIGTGARSSLASAKHDLASLRFRPPRRILIIRVACRGNEKRV